MILVPVALLLAALALATKFGVVWFERKYPPRGRFVHVSGARLHVVEIGPANAQGLPIVMIAGAGSSTATMRKPLGEHLARTHRVILIDRPGQGWSTRDRLQDSTPTIHARMIGEAIERLGIDRAIFVGHSWGGAVMPALARDVPQRVAGIVMLSAVTYPWQGNVDLIFRICALPLIGPLLAHTVILPAGLLMMEAGVREVFDPQRAPLNFIEETEVPLVLRPRRFLNNAYDLASLRAALAQQSPDYPNIKMPVTLIAGDSDKIVSTDIHSRQFAKSVPQAKLLVLANVGHMPQVAACDVIAQQIMAMARTVTSTAAD